MRCVFVCRLYLPFIASRYHQKKELEEMLQTSWLRVHVPVEVKAKADDKQLLAAVKQLYRSLRQVLKEQVDRRFAIGLVFCRTDLSVWLCDRSGLLGTATPFNIHKVCTFYLCLY